MGEAKKAISDMVVEKQRILDCSDTPPSTRPQRWPESKSDGSHAAHWFESFAPLLTMPGEC